MPRKWTNKDMPTDPEKRRAFIKEKEFADSKAHFEEMLTDYGIMVVDHEHFVAEDEKSKLKVFTLVDSIVGQNLEDISLIPF